MDKAAKPLKIFISYGHEIGITDESGNPLYPDPNNENVVLKIKAYLKSRGHDVWLDKERIKPGAEWRKSIYDGVEWSDVALICLSRKAMKLNGVCRDEISIAMGVRGGNMLPIKLEALEDSEYPAYLLHRQLFTQFMDWRLHTTEKSIDEAWLDQNLKELAKALENKDVCRYGEEVVELKNILKPWNMSSRLKSLDRETQCLFSGETLKNEEVTVHKFCGRQSLFEMFDGKIAQGGQAVRIKSDRVLWLKKGPGFGKSRFAAELLYRCYYVISAAYFIEYNQRESLNPNTFVKSVAFQLAQANSSYREKLLKYLKENQEKINLQTGDPQTLFKLLVVDLMSDEIDGGRATQWILVDALDEATENNRNEIASLISQNLDRLPPWICFFITSRDRDNAVNRNFAQFIPIDFHDEENEHDVRDYILNEFKGMDITVSEELVKILQEKSEGTFLYPKMVLEDLKKKSFALDDIRDLPSGVIAYIHSQFERLFGSDIKSYKRDIRPMLGFILTSCEPISRAVLKYGLDIRRDSELDDLLEQLGTFFIQSGSTDEDTVVPFHKSVIDYCFDKTVSLDYYVYPDEANEDFANRGLELYKTGALQWTKRTDEEPDAVQRYFLTWLPSHLMIADMTKEAADLLSDFAFLMKRLRFGNVERVVLDYILFRNKLNRISSDSDAYFDVICSNAHFLRRNSEDNPAYKIMLQIATEVADDCPVTQAAERWLNPDSGDSPCDWFWLNKVNRPKEYQPNPCKLVIENAGNRVKLLSNGDALSWGTGDHNLRIWNLETGVCKAVLEGHTDIVWDAIELRSGVILSWSADMTLRLWSPDGMCKAVLEGHTCSIKGVIELRSGDIFSWCDYSSVNNEKDYTLRLWSPDGMCKAVMKGHTDYVYGAIELRSGDILSWSKDRTLRLWSPDGMCKAALEGHTSWVKGAIELRSGDILSWCTSFFMDKKDNTLRLWSPDGTCKAVLEGHNDEIDEAIELRSGNILSWCTSYNMDEKDTSLRLWSPDGMCKAVLEGHTAWVGGAIELRSGDILSWSLDKTLRLWSPDGTCKTVLEGHNGFVRRMLELQSSNILSWCASYLKDKTSMKKKDMALRLWSPDGTCKAVMEGHTDYIKNVIELTTGDVLSWSGSMCDYPTLLLWSPDGTCKAVLEGHTDAINGALELNSGDILSWSDDKSMRLWSPNATCKKEFEGHMGLVQSSIELRSGDILSCSDDATIRLWSSNGVCKAVLEGHADEIKDIIELRSGNFLSWGNEKTIYLWSPDGKCIADLDGHTESIIGVLELRSGDILSWSWDNSIRIWSSEGKCKTILEGHTDFIEGVLELRSGDILSWSWDYSLRIWSSEGKCKAVLKGHNNFVNHAIEIHSGDIFSWGNDDTLRIWTPFGAPKAVLKENAGYIWETVELSSGDILSNNTNDTLHIWSSDGACKKVITSQNPQFDSLYTLLHKEQVHQEFYSKESDWGIELQHDFKPIVRWNSPSCDSRFVGAGRLCVWYGRFVDFLQLNYGNHRSVSFDQAHQLLTGEIDESKLVAFVPEQDKQ